MSDLKSSLLLATRRSGPSQPDPELLICEVQCWRCATNSIVTVALSQPSTPQQSCGSKNTDEASSKTSEESSPYYQGKPQTFPFGGDIILTMMDLPSTCMCGALTLKQLDSILMQKISDLECSALTMGGRFRYSLPQIFPLGCDCSAELSPTEYGWSGTIANSSTDMYYNGSMEKISKKWMTHFSCIIAYKKTDDTTSNYSLHRTCE